MRRSTWQKILSDQTAEKDLEQAKLETNQAIPKVTEVDPTDRVQFASDDTVDAFSFQGRRLKVIVKVMACLQKYWLDLRRSPKAANYQLKVGQTYDGSWHMEGMVRVESVVMDLLIYLLSRSRTKEL